MATEMTMTKTRRSSPRIVKPPTRFGDENKINDGSTEKRVSGFKVFLAVKRKKWIEEGSDWNFDEILSRATELWNELTSENKEVFELKATEINNSKKKSDSEDDNPKIITGFEVMFLDKALIRHLETSKNFDDIFRDLSNEWKTKTNSDKTIYEARAKKASKNSELSGSSSSYSRCSDYFRKRTSEIKFQRISDDGFGLFCKETVWDTQRDDLRPEDYPPEVIDQWKNGLSTEDREIFEARARNEQENPIIEDKDLKCSSCQRNYENFDRFLEHFDESCCLITCPICEFKADSTESLKNHAVNNHSCNFCSKEFKSILALIQHRKSEHLIQCKICRQLFSQEGNLRRHYIKIHLGLSERPCEFCGEKFLDPEKLHGHVIRTHFGVDSKSSRKSSSKQPRRRYSKPSMELTLTCTDCDGPLTFDTLAKLKYHRLKIHGKWQNGVRCSECGKGYETESNLRRHLRDIHSSGPLKKSGMTLIKCEECSFTTKDRFHLKVHKRKHTGERPFKCSKCTFGFYKASDLRNHEKRCPGVKFRCSKCDTIFHFKKQLRDHNLWSESCGSILDKTKSASSAFESPNPGLPPDNKRYIEGNPTIVRLNINKDTSVVGISCENLIDKRLFYKRKKKSRCGICSGCELQEDCGVCKSCFTKKRPFCCEKRQCLNLVHQYDVRKEKRKEFKQKQDVTSIFEVVEENEQDDEQDDEIEDEQQEIVVEEGVVFDIGYEQDEDEIIYVTTTSASTSSASDHQSNNLMLMAEAAHLEEQGMIVINEEIIG